MRPDPKAWKAVLLGLIFQTHLAAGGDQSKPVPLDPANIPESEEATVAQIYRHLVATRKVEDAASMEDYTATVPATGASYSMIAIPGGKVLMGSPGDEPDRNPDEGPRYTAEVGPFWMGKFEVTWDEYEPFMITGSARRKDGTLLQPHTVDSFAELVSSPTTPYTEMSFGMGTDGYPAICMTHHAASKYCQWLSAQTGHFYRLPTEAEWEYACRAGTTTAYWFGDDSKEMMKYEVIDPHQIRPGYAKIGIGKPNPFGLYDMLGSVMEWCLDGYVEDRRAALRNQGADNADKNHFLNPHVQATTRYPRVARGGSWFDPPELCRSASRTASGPQWIVQDPQEPNSLWYLSDAFWLGFRLVRPLEIPTEEEMFRIWNSGNVHHIKKRE